MNKPTICLDFDGVLNNYDGWQGEKELFGARDGAKDFIKELSKNYQVHILTTRMPIKVIRWLKKHGLDKYVTSVTNTKIGAVAYIDDRAICFNGNYDEVLNTLKDFKAHWEK